MASELRAYFMLRAINREWSISVHRDLEGVLKIWSERSEIDAVGVIHIGFDRPRSQEFNEISERYPGRVLLTASARYSMPASFVASKDLVGEVAGFPIYLALRGWGYTAEDDAAIATQSEKQPEGWVAAFLEKHPEHSELFRNHKIWDDARYQATEEALSFDLRRYLGIYRFHFLINGKVEDPCAIAAAAPPWFADRNFETIDLTVRAGNVLRNSNILTVRDLSRMSVDQLLSLPNFGVTSVRDLSNSLLASMREGPEKNYHFHPDANLESNDEVDEAFGLLVSLRQSMLDLSERDRNILQRRMGYAGEVETLQEIADDYDITRERIRQIESKGIQKLKKAPWARTLASRISTQLGSREYPLPVIGIEAIDPWFDGVADSLNVFRFLVSFIYEGDVALIEIDGIDYFSLISQQRWDTSIDEARRLLQSGVGESWSKKHCEAVVMGLLPDKSKEFQSMLWEKASALCHFSIGPDGVEVLTSYGRGVDQVVEAVLAESDQPLHFTTIANLASDRAGKSIDIRRAHNAAASVGYLMSPGTYGVDRHLPDSAVIKEIGEQAEEIVLNGPHGRQWHTSEILATLSENENVSASQTQLDKYLIDIALQKSGGLRRFGRMVWAIADHSDDVGRIDIREAIVSVLQEAGRPLRSEELRQRIMALRGVNQHFQIVAIDPVVRIDDSLWGLNDRDVAIKRADQSRLIDGLAAILTKHGIGVHFSELERSNIMQLSGMSVQTLCSLACSDGRLAISSGQYLYLREWRGPRRESLSEAVRAVLNEAQEPLPVDVISTRVEERIRRSIKRQSVINCLRALEARLDVGNQKWSAAKAESSEEDDLAMSA